MQSDAHMKGAEYTPVPGYSVTPDGRVFSVASNWRGYGRREMQRTLNADGYPSVRLMVNGKRVRLAVHRLVAASYLSPRPSPAHEVRHLDGDRLNPRADNLAWGTRKENADDRARHGRTSSGSAHGTAIKRGQALAAAKKSLERAYEQF